MNNIFDIILQFKSLFDIIILWSDMMILKELLIQYELNHLSNRYVLTNIFCKYIFKSRRKIRNGKNL